MSTLFISDIHLEDSRPQALDWLRAFLSGPARRADAVYILGDLFEYWIGDDAPSPAARQLARDTAKLAESGVPCHFLHGNRDFLLGEAYAASAGLRLLPECLVVDLYGTPTLLLHGDTLCTDDTEYQAFRRQSRDPAWQAMVLKLPIEERLRLAREARDASARHTGTVAMDIMDVNGTAVVEAFRRHGTDILFADSDGWNEVGSLDWSERPRSASSPDGALDNGPFNALLGAELRPPLRRSPHHPGKWARRRRPGSG